MVRKCVDDIQKSERILMLRILDGFVFSLANLGKATAKVDPNFLEPLSAPARPRSLQFYRVSCLYSCRAGAEKRETNETWQIPYKPTEPRKICKPVLLAMILCCEIVVLLLILLEPQLEADSLLRVQPQVGVTRL